MAQNPLANLIHQARERLNEQLKAQAEELGKIEQSLQELRNRHQQFEGAVEQQLAALENAEVPSGAPAAGGEGSLEKVLAAVRNLITATLPEQVQETLTEEAEGMGVRAAVFDVRGRAAWGSAARGFGAQLPEKALRSLVVPLNQDNPFRQVVETGGHIDANVDTLKKVRNVVDKFKPAANDAIILLPIRSAGAVSAIFYADAGGKGKILPVDGLKILSEFAGAQLDRLMALSGGVSAAEAPEVEAEPVEAVAVEAGPAEAPGPEPASAAAAPVESAPVVEAPPPPPPPAAPAGFDLSQLSEADQKLHKDAKRFAKLLISEIELYNKAKVADGRKNKDLYKRMKTDIERSRQTFEKRFGKTLGKQFDYFHEEVVRTLAGNDPTVLGADYPGPSA